MSVILDYIRAFGELIGYAFIAALVLYGLFVRGSTPFGRNHGSRGSRSGPYRDDRSSQELYERNLRSGPDNH
ncbi:hypothetical protein [Sphingomonas prati]|uniref:Uncharacterized protein n=1 Tax=Sphingomonas prati TaxID=1843237 RepID=A0A7W9BVG6_9SPHN|nr:hypothetical protein [Sphingomonas prati]MBB5730881.1 hypothetical protein [Sphingomonas prati]GGE97494.1 hypothetical protein GCM10011404_33310 [Sphingomonas prati]